ncbi:MAG: putative holin-like toxin [Lactobacillus sp.]|nr:putative holin-like toxin [Lactobacillus sp.]
MSVYEAISLMLLFGTFMLALLTYIDHHNKKQTKTPLNS